MQTETVHARTQGRQNKTVADVMHHGAVTCTLDTPIPQVARLLTQQDVSALPVVDAEGFLVGILTRTDLVALRAYEDYWREMQAEHVMVHTVHTITPDQTVAEASRRMTERKIHRLIVVEFDSAQHAKPLGIIAQSDIVRDMALE
ncbi:MAG: CBS domain-containing protein [Chloroflexi bacterium]|nr:CBS domain-containing protein [Chloroflexota bacterium]